MINLLKLLIYRLKGKKPWSRGYIASRTEFIKQSLARNFDINSIPKNHGIGFDERVIEYPWIFSRLSKNKSKLLDAGSVLNFEYILKHSCLKEKQITISTLSPEQNCFWFKNVSYVYEDFRDSCFKDEYFDEIICLSTLEHVGLDNNVYLHGGAESGIKGDTLGANPAEMTGTYLHAIAELERILKPGGKLFLSMPFGKHIKHGWLQVFDYKMIDKIYSQFSFSDKQEWIYLYTFDGWKSSSREEASNAIYYDKHNLNSKKIDSLAASESVICIELTKIIS